MKPLAPGRLARCRIDGLPLEMRAYGAVVVVGCMLDHVAAYYGPRPPLEPAPFRTTPRRAVAAPTCFTEAVRAFHLRALP